MIILSYFKTYIIIIMVVIVFCVFALFSLSELSFEFVCSIVSLGINGNVNANIIVDKPKRNVIGPSLGNSNK